MKLKIIAPAKPEPIYKASVHKTGRIGFTVDSAKNFNIDISKSLILAINSDDNKNDCIYGILSKIDDTNGYKIQKAGKYHSVNATEFFDAIFYMYEDGSISFLLSEIK